MKKLFTILTILIWIPFVSIISKETFNWYFGDKCAISFNTPDGEPIAVPGSEINTLEGCSSISDANGNLLFYTDGVKVWNKKNTLMNQSQDLKGHYSSTQSVLIVRKPQSNYLYYIFTTDAGEYIENIDPSLYKNRGLQYSVVDMRLNNGLGGIIELNTLLTKPITEKLAALFHANGSDIWIVSHEGGTKNVISYLLTAEGIKDTVISQGSISHSGDKDRYIGYLKPSPKGDKIAYVVQGFNFIELQNFDNQTGIISNSTRIYTEKRVNNYGLEFSPNGKLIYVSDYKSNTIYQYDISVSDTAQIQSSQYMVVRDTVTHSIGALQIGPNGKIYVALNGRKCLGVIRNPNLQGEDCNYQQDGIFLGNDIETKSRLGLPNLNVSFFDFQVKIDYNKTCQYENLVLKARIESDFEETQYEWYGPNEFYSNSRDLIFTNASSALNGKYYLSAKYREYLSSDSIEVKIKDAPIVKIIGDTLICVNSFSVLETGIKNDSLTFIWSTGEIADRIIISSPGSYTLQTLYPNGCSAYDTINVNGLMTNASFTDVNSGLFGKIPINKQHILQIDFINNGTEELTINSVYLIKQKSFCRLTEEDKGTLQPKSKRRFLISLFSKSPVFVDDSLVVEIVSPYCKIYFYLDVKGDIVVPVIVSIPNLKGEPADILEIPILAKINTPSDTTFNLHYKANISLPSAYFQPDSCHNGVITSNEIINGIRFLTIEGEKSSLSVSESEIAKLSGRVLVGNVESALINIVEIEWENPFFINEIIDGKLNIESCSLAIRPIKLFKPTVMKLFPNPVNNVNLNVTIESEEKGDFELYIISLEGDKQVLNSWTRQKDDAVEVNQNYNLDNLGSGTYFLILKSPWNRITHQISIVR
ncbi:MAG: T9SS type A sorting domain-containing protein [Candidatus Kapabacteria bacterium]|nr:T9SS type A sorting domain-containing protein [Candidatus Kapabacteria bacterium]